MMDSRVGPRSVVPCFLRIQTRLNCAAYAYLTDRRALACRNAVSYLCTAGWRWRGPPAALLGRFLPRLRAAPSGVAFFVSADSIRIKRNQELGGSFFPPWNTIAPP